VHATGRFVESGTGAYWGRERGVPVRPPEAAQRLEDLARGASRMGGNRSRSAACSSMAARLGRIALLSWTGVLSLGGIGAATDCRAQAGSGTVRVAPTGSNGNGCGSVASPCQTLQFAVDQFPLSGTGTVLVAAGTYTSSDPRQVLRVTRRQITMQGGYTTAFTTADPDANPVTIDGQSARKGILVDCPPGPDVCRLTLSGVTLTAGNAPPDAGISSAFGGGLDAFLATIELLDVDVLGNTARGLDASSGLPGDGGGGGLSFRQVNATLTRVELTGNTAQGGDGTGTAVRGGLGVGGGIFALDSTVVLTDVTADGNVARAGDAPSANGVAGGQRADGLGGFWALIQSSGGATRLTATGNRAEGGEAGSFGGLGLGGAIFVEDTTAPVTFDSVTIHDNTALGGNAGAGGSEGGLGGGGAIFCTDSVLTIDKGVLAANVAEGGDGVAAGGSGGGGGVYLDSVLPQAAALHATNVVFGRNAGIAGSGTTPGAALGGGIFQQCPQLNCASASTASSAAVLTHVTLADNAVSGARYNQGAALYVSAFASATSFFGIVSGHATPVTVDDRGEAVLTWGATSFHDTLWDGNTLKAFAAPGGVFTDDDPRNGSPDYVDPAAAPPDYHVQGTSAAREEAAGSATATDLDGQPRPAPGGDPDLGADEFHAPEPEAGFAGGAALTLLAALGRARRRAA
jgi:hypothetical protein